jgi:hypothetical protein
MTDEQLDEALAALRELLAQRAREEANVIEGAASRGAVPGGYARAQAQVEPPDEGSRHGGRPAGAQVEQAMKRGRGRDFAFALVKMK